MKSARLFFGAALAAATVVQAQAADYDLDPAHSFIEFRVQHLGYSWLYGRFNAMSGTFSYDSAAPADSKIKVEIDTASVDSNHAERDKHLRNEDFLHVEEYPTATFESTGFEGDADGGVLKGKLTLHGVTKEVAIDVKKMGEGKDPWGGYRAGFIGTTTLNRKEFDVSKDLGPKGWDVELELGIEGIRKE